MRGWAWRRRPIALARGRGRGCRGVLGRVGGSCEFGSFGGYYFSEGRRREEGGRPSRVVSFGSGTS